MLREFTFCATLLLGGSLVMAQPGGGGRGEGGAGGGRGGFGNFPNPIFDAIDKDGDGVISAQELEGAVAALKALDKDGDGKITREEVRPQFGNRGGQPGGGGQAGGGGGQPGGGFQLTEESYIARYMNLDTNKDGKLSAEELGERGARLLETADTNGDKFIDADELKAAAASAVERSRNRTPREGGQPGGGGRGRGGDRGGNNRI